MLIKNKKIWLLILKVTITLLLLPLFILSLTVHNDTNKSDSKQSNFQIASKQLNSQTTKLTVVNNQYFVTLNNILIGLTSLGRQQSRLNIPYSVTFIASIALSNDKNLKDLIIPNSVISIGSYAFSGCTNLRSVNLPMSVKYIGWGIFDNCPMLLSDGVRNHTTILFDWWVKNHLYNKQTLSQMDKIELNNYKNDDNQSFTTIADFAFVKCRKLKQICIPNSICTIGNNIFFECNLSSDNVISFSPVLFDWWIRNHLYSIQEQKKVVQQKVSTLNNLVELDLNQFKNSADKQFTIIADSAFENCFKLYTVMIPEGVTIIKNDAFDHCVNLRRIALPKSITAIGYNAFWDIYYQDKVQILTSSKKVQQLVLDSGLKISDKQFVTKFTNYFLNAKFALGLGLALSLGSVVLVAAVTLVYCAIRKNKN